MEWIAVAIGGGLGAALRYFVQQSIMKVSVSGWWSTVFVNLSGSFLLGLIGGAALKSDILIGLLAVGMLGAFTTFSTFAFDIVKLMDNRKWMVAAIYSVVNLLGGLAAFSLGWMV